MKVLFVLLYPVSPAVFGDFTDILPEGDREPSPASSHYEPLFTLHHGIDKDDTSFHPSPLLYEHWGYILSPPTPLFGLPRVKTLLLRLYFCSLE